MKNFNIEEQFLQYLKLVKLDMNTMPLTQIIETKRAFIAGVGQLLVFMLQAQKTHTDEEGANMLTDLDRQLTVYWEMQLDQFKAEGNTKKTNC